MPLVLALCLKRNSFENKTTYVRSFTMLFPNYQQVQSRLKTLSFSFKKVTVLLQINVDLVFSKVANQ